MESAKNLFKEQLTTVSKYKKQLSVVESNKNHLAAKQVDSILDEFAHLISTEFRAWYATQVLKLGVDTFVRLAKTAEQEGNNPARYFSWLLKHES